jgi:hypothetical protein
MKKEKTEKNKECLDFQSIKNDPQGSWTGTPENPEETPVQDADDL